MAVKINFNEAAAMTHTALLRNERALHKSLLRLSTGYRILSAADDAAGLFISDMLSTVAKGLDQGNKNIQTGISALQIAEAAAGQIYDKLQEIYIRAQNAANDINDPNARAALQSEIRNFVEAIQKIASDTEYNGIKLLDGTFDGKYIHYGPRVYQTINLNIEDIRAQSIGAYMISSHEDKVSVTCGSGQLSGLSNNAWVLDSNDYLKINGAVVLKGEDTGTYLVDAAEAAKNINEKLSSAGIKATAVNVSRAEKFTSLINTTADSVTMNFYIGKENINNPTFTLEVKPTITLDDLVARINQAASAKGAPITAYNDNGHLVLKTTNGETIAIEVQVDSNVSATVNFNQLIEGASATTVSNGYAYAIKVGHLHIASDRSFKVSAQGVSDTKEGLALQYLDTSTGDLKYISDTTKTANLYNLFAIDVTKNVGAERAMLIAEFALQKVDKVRSYIGATVNNLQSIFDAQKVAYDNTKQAESVIRNTDYAKEMAEFTTYQIRMQTTIAMLAQANALPQLVLQLLR